ncbi:hypothetical protein PV327_000152 [Microctonus hyperodae]|uniref:Uncharacterized protein n=1 Tax=Microctonus hyperodae TaxID=165561 RepID=A0AA39L212_MICHY|nr:hypothetical protein PV327_000152 [Microctonus hyperodae]
MRLMQRVAISGLLSIMLIVLLTGTFLTRRDLVTSVVDRGIGQEEGGEQINPAWVQDNALPNQDHQGNDIRERRPVVNVRHRPPIYFEESSAVAPAPGLGPGEYIVGSPNPPLDDVTNQRREKVKEVFVWLNFILMNIA